MRLFNFLTDKIGIDCSRTFGAKQYHLTKRVLNQGMWACVIVFLGFTTPCFLLSDDAEVHGHDEDSADDHTDYDCKYTGGAEDALEALSHARRPQVVADELQQVGEQHVVQYLVAEHRGVPVYLEPHQEVVGE